MELNFWWLLLIPMFGAVIAFTIEGARRLITAPFLVYMLYCCCIAVPALFLGVFGCILAIYLVGHPL